MAIRARHVLAPLLFSLGAYGNSSESAAGKWDGAKCVRAVSCIHGFPTPPEKGSAP